MKILGTVLHISTHKNIIIRGDKKDNLALPKLNSIVFNHKMKKLGKINDVFGPVDHPFFSVRAFEHITGENFRDFKHKHVYIK